MIKIYVFWSHLDFRHPARVSFLWPSAGFFEMLSGEDNADSYSTEQDSFGDMCLSWTPSGQRIAVYCRNYQVRAKIWAGLMWPRREQKCCRPGLLYC
jgi:hypothetical protein